MKLNTVATTSNATVVKSRSKKKAVIVKDDGTTIILKIVFDEEWDEHQVQWIENGELDEAKTYHTDDKEDAIDTMKDMIGRELSR